MRAAACYTVCSTLTNSRFLVLFKRSFKSEIDKCCNQKLCCLCEKQSGKVANINILVYMLLNFIPKSCILQETHEHAFFQLIFSVWHDLLFSFSPFFEFCTTYVLTICFSPLIHNHSATLPAINTLATKQYFESLHMLNIIM